MQQIQVQGMQGMQEPRCTLFLTGLPFDMKERELRNIFRFYSGFIGCRVTTKKVTNPPNDPSSAGPEAPQEASQFMAFCLFNSEQAAMEVKECLDGTQFDYLDPESPLFRISFAKKNLVIRQPYGGEGTRLNSRGLAAAAQMYYGAVDGSQVADPYRQQDPYAAAAAAAAYQQPYAVPQQAGAKRPRAGDVGQPSTTLYVSNLGGEVYQEELKQLFATQAGYEDLSVARSKGRAFAFVLFKSEEEAGTALQSLQGYQLMSVPAQGGLRISYSKTPYRPKRPKTEDYGTEGLQHMTAPGL